MALTKISGNVVQQNNFSLSGVVTATSFTGDLTGNVTGNVTGTATTATNLADGANITTGTISNDRLPSTITKNLTGDVTGNLTGNVTGNVSSSGANTLGSLTVTNDATVGGALTVTGNLTVNGTTTTIDTVVTAIDSLAVDGDVTAGGNLNITGVSTFGGNVDLGDDDILRFGAGQDLQIYHDGGQSYITNATSDLRIRSNYVKLQGGNGENMLVGNQNTSVEIYYDNSKKFETTSTGAKVTGDLNVTGILTVGQSSVTIDGTNNKITTPKLDYAGISSSISDTATDVFVYDTRKDSDGGAWRKRTQHTSWYNETLNTATRGSRREFPAVAVIVGSNDTDGLVIYDGDDPDLPMWMVFQHTSFGALNNNNATYLTNAVAMLNGKLCAAVVNGSTTGGLAIIDFLEDSCYRSHQSGSTYSGYYFRGTKVNPGIVNRNAGGIGFNGQLGKYSDWIVNSTANDVAMTVLPNAPIDDATGLPVPTIAVATDGGLSVIKDDGSVVDITSTKAVNDVELVHFDKAGRLYFAAQASSSITDVYHYSRYTIPSADITNNVYADNSDATYYPRDTSGASFQNERPNFNAQYNDGVNEDITHISSNDDGGIVGNVNGLSIFAEDYSSQGNGMVAYAATSYNTGWMHGDIKGAFLSSTDATNAVGTELHPNGNSDFSSTDISYITNSASGTATVTSGQLVVSGGTSNYSDHIINITTVVGQQYVISIDYVTNNGTNGKIGMYVNGAYLNEANDGSGWISRSTGKTYTWYFTADATNENIDLVTSGSASDTYTFDNWSIKAVEEDRSVNNKGLQVFGTVTKSAVATGAELVAYSFGANNANYLEQPYNSDLDFGTGAYSITCWLRVENDTTSIAIDKSLPTGSQNNNFSIY